jgi:hypothetical protein
MAVLFVFPTFISALTVLKSIILFKRGAIADKEVGELSPLHNKHTSRFANKRCIWSINFSDVSSDDSPHMRARPTLNMRCVFTGCRSSTRGLMSSAPTAPSRVCLSTLRDTEAPRGTRFPSSVACSTMLSAASCRCR